MRKWEVELALRTAGRIARENQFYLIGSQAVHACCRRAPTEVLLSQECDLYPVNRPETANLLDAQLGRGSPFAQRRGFYVDVVTPELASLPPGWQSRLKILRAGRITALCLEVHDLIVSKLAAGRLKDLEFVGALLQRRLASLQVLRRRIGQFPSPRDRTQLRSRLRAALEDLGSQPVRRSTKRRKPR